MIAQTPEPPYYAVIFTSKLNVYTEAYQQIAKNMIALAQEQEGFLGFESARNEVGVSISYWRDLASFEKWQKNPEHIFAKEKGKSEWYEAYTIRITKVESEYSFEKEN